MNYASVNNLFFFNFCFCISASYILSHNSVLDIAGDPGCIVPDLTISNPPERTWQDLGTQIRPEPEPNLRELVSGSQNNMDDETNDVNNAVSCYKEAVPFTASLITLLFASF